MRKLWLLLAIILVALAVVFTSAKKISLDDTSIGEFSDLSLTGVTMEGVITVSNNGFVPAYVENITYNVRLEEVSGVIGNGVVEGGVLKAGETKDFPVSMKLEWVPSVDTALDLIFSDKTYAQVSGTVNLVSLKYVKLALPFTARVNLEGYIEQFAVEVPIVSDIADIATDIMDDFNVSLDDITDIIDGVLG